MVSVLASSAVDRGFEPRSGQTKNYKIGICCFSDKHAALRRKSKDLMLWKISADQNLQSSFLQKLPNIWNNLSDPPHGDCIPLDGKYLVAGVLKGKSVPLQLL